MKTTLKNHLLFILLGLGFCAYFFGGVTTVPFHPDESTNLFMSADFELWITNPLSLIWEQQNISDIRQHYREIDAPLTRYILGFGYAITRENPLPEDWDWGETWEGNLGAGAFPSPQQLVIGRTTMAAFFPLSLIFLYLAGLQIQGRTTGLLAVVFFSTNSLVLLHTRRAMAEGPLVFATIFFLWGLTHINFRAWFLGLAAALAFNSKHSLGALGPVGLVASMWTPSDEALQKRLIAGVQYLAAFLVLSLALNPVLWRQPITVAKKSIEARTLLVAAQVEDFGSQNPALILDSFGDRLLAATAQLYLLPPSFQEAGNYLTHSIETRERYLSIPGHGLFRNITTGGLFLTVTLFGIFIGVRNIRKVGWDEAKKLVLLLTATSVQTLAILLVIPLPFQRYYLPLVPYSVIWFSYGLAHILMAIKHQIPQQSPTKSSPGTLE